MDFVEKVKEWFLSTKIDEQIREVDVAGLFTNLWFVIPFGVLVGYLLFKKRIRDLIILAIFVGVWWVTGTDYMNTLIIGDELQMHKVLPVVFGGAAVLGFVIYLLFGRSD